jgi:hypothetical protein
VNTTAAEMSTTTTAVSAATASCPPPPPRDRVPARHPACSPGQCRAKLYQW